MVDPFSIAGSTAGIVSLGLQVCGGLITYYGAWKSHDKDVEEVFDKLTDLESTLKTLAGILSIVESLDDNRADPLQAARQKIHSCIDNLEKLQLALIKFESICQPTGVLDKIHNVRLRGMSFFTREELKGLRRSATETQINLSGANQILSLWVDLAYPGIVRLRFVPRQTNLSADT